MSRTFLIAILATLLAGATSHAQERVSSRGAQPGAPRELIAASPAPPGDPVPPSDAGSPVPEPTTFLLVGTGLLGLAISSRRWRRLSSS